MSWYHPVVLSSYPSDLFFFFFVSLLLESFTITFFGPLLFLRLYPVAIFDSTWIHHDLQLFKNSKQFPFQILVCNTFKYVTKLWTLPSIVTTIAKCLSFQPYKFFLELSIHQYSDHKSCFKSESWFLIPASVVSNLL